MSPSAHSSEVSLTVNGEERTITSGATVATLVAALVGEARMVAVERNGEIVPRTRWGATPLADGDRVELVRFVQGG